MAGTTLLVRDAQFSKVVANLRLPFLDGLFGEYVFGVNAAQSTKNQANPAGAPAITVGTPTYGDYYAQIKTLVANQGFNLGYTFTQPDLTIVLVIQAISGCPVWCATTAAGITGFCNTTGAAMLANANTGTANQADTAVPTHGNYAVFAGTAPLSTKQRIYTWTAGVRSMDEAEVAGGATRGAGSIVVGTSSPGGVSGTANIAYLALFARTLSSTELNSVYSSLKNYYNGKIVIS